MISVVTPTYFRNDRLDRAIRSVQAQTYGDVEHVVVDGSEEEHAREVVQHYEDVTYLAPVADPGFHKSRELGVRESAGEFVQFLDDDDWLEPSKLERSLAAFEDGVGVVYCGIRHHSSGRVELPDPDARGDVFHRALAFDMFPATPSTWLVKRDVLEDVLPFEHNDGADDEGTHVEFAQRTRYEFVNEPLVVLGTENQASFNRTRTYVDQTAALLEKYADLYVRAPDWVEHNARSKVHFKRGMWYVRNAYWSPRAVREFVRAARYAQDDELKRWATAALSVFGRPGIATGERVLEWTRPERHVG